ncbi:MAG: PorT family protein [Bacteroidia bacterium]|nr:PorT family protein [Bacteroidia bacterium]
MNKMNWVVKFFIAIIFACSAIIFSYAQSNEKRFFIGVSAGLTGCQVHGDSYSGYNKLGFLGGVFVHYKWFQNIIPQVGIIYIQKGSRHNPDSANLSQYLLRLHFIEIPMNVKFLFLKKKKLFITIGHSIAYLFDYFEETNYLNTTHSVKNEKFEFSINTGFGYQINDYFNIELRANNGYTPFRYFAFPSNIYYNNPIARMFNKGLYNNILELIFTYHIYGKSKEE